MPAPNIRPASSSAAPGAVAPVTSSDVGPAAVMSVVMPVTSPAVRVLGVRPGGVRGGLALSARPADLPGAAGFRLVGAQPARADGVGQVPGQRLVLALDR